MAMLGLSRGLCSCPATSFIFLSKFHPACQPLRRAPSCLSLCRAGTYDADEGFYGDSCLLESMEPESLSPATKRITKSLVRSSSNAMRVAVFLSCIKPRLLARTTQVGTFDVISQSRNLLLCKGCYFTDDPPKENGFEVIKGQKWCLGYETAPESEESFSAVIGADGWSVALTASEFNDFCQLIQTLRRGIATMDEDGFIGKDDISMQVEKGSMWMECTIPKKKVAILQNLWKLGNWGLLDNQQTSAFELRFVISGSGRRQAEGFWPAEAVMDMLKKIDAINSE